MVNFSLPVFLILASQALAQCPDPSGPLKDAISSLDDLTSKVETTNNAVNSFDKSQGINGALDIQKTEGDIESAATDLTKKTSALSDLDDCGSKALAAAASNAGDKIVALLDSITSKQPDLAAVGTSDIVKNDLTSLQKKLHDFISTAYEKVTCTGVDEISSSFDKINSAYQKALKAYDVTGASPPSKPSSCRQGAGAGSAGSSAAGSANNAGSTAAAAPTSAASTAAATGASVAPSGVGATGTGVSATSSSSASAGLASASPSVVPSNDGTRTSIAMASIAMLSAIGLAFWL